MGEKINENKFFFVHADLTRYPNSLVLLISFDKFGKLASNTRCPRIHDTFLNSSNI